jgi:chromosome segregation ATPase
MSEALTARSVPGVPAGLAELVRGFATRSAPVPVLDWLPLVEVALDAPAGWAAVFAALRVEQQFDLIDRLRADGAGPWAEALLLILSTHALEIADEQVRADVLADAEVAAERRTARGAALRERLEALASTVGRASDRLRDGFDVAGEMAALEARLARLRSQAHEREGDFARMFELEHEILRAETQIGVLERYDAQERQRVRDELRAEATALSERKSTLEAEVGRATAERDRVRHDVVEMQGAHAAAIAELDALRAESTSLSTSVPRLRVQTEALRTETARLRAEQEALATEAAGLGEAQRAAAEGLAAERRRMEELAAAARGAGAEEIERKVQEVLAMLPPDAVDQAL